MPKKEIDRKIAVIFATDVVNYSKHMEIDENETVKSLRFYEKILKGLFKNIMAIYLIRGATLLWPNSLALWMRWSAL